MGELSSKEQDTKSGKPVFEAIDRLVHEPARLMILAHLAVVKQADFVFLQRYTGLTHGNLSSHMSKLEDAGYVQVEKTFVDRKPKTMFSITEIGLDAFMNYRKSLREMLDSGGRDSE